jgi:RNA polymerase sigma-70 factor (ECF subfamily)
VRWQRRDAVVDAPKAFLVKIVTRLCLNELGSARARREEARGDRLPEPIDLDESGIGGVELLDQVSMAFLVLLQRLTPAERAVLLLHDVFDLSHAEIAALVGKTEAACRQLLGRARDNVAAERRVFRASAKEHSELLRAFLQATRSGEVGAITRLLAEDATLVVDAGPDGARVGKIRNVGRPIIGARRIAAFLHAVGREDKRVRTVHEHVLNGQPAIVLVADGRATTAILLSVADGKIRHVFVQADASRLGHVGTLH